MMKNLVTSFGFGALLLFAGGTNIVAQSPPPRLDRNNLLIYLDGQDQIQPVQSIADWRKRRATVLAGMQQVMGPLPGNEKRCPLDVKVDTETDCGSFVRRLITYASEPGGRVPAYLLIPKRALDGKEKAAAVLCLHPTDHDFPSAMREIAYRLFDAVLRNKDSRSKHKHAHSDNTSPNVSKGR